MGKIIIHIKTELSDSEALNLVQRVVQHGLISGSEDNAQYCYATTFSLSQYLHEPNVGNPSNTSQTFVVIASKKGDTHTFKVQDEDLRG